jgi:membrane protease YdiL (CAAX protease family)
VEALPPEADPEPVPEPEIPPVPWTVRDTWLGVLFLVLTLAAILALTVFLPKGEWVANILMIASELILLLPMAAIFLWKRISWRSIGFGKFQWNSMAWGCGGLIAVYPLIMLHNIVLFLLGVETQGKTITQIMQVMESPWAFVFSAVILAPLAEEIVFRGFFFAGFRQRYGWVPAVLISSAIFGASHLQLVAFIPTFLLGMVMAYAYHRSNSIWPGVIIHFWVNGSSLLLTLLAIRFGMH